MSQYRAPCCTPGPPSTLSRHKRAQDSQTGITHVQVRLRSLKLTRPLQDCSLLCVFSSTTVWSLLERKTTQALVRVTRLKVFNPPTSGILQWDLNVPFLLNCWITWVWTIYRPIFSNKYSNCVFILQIFKWTKGRGKCVWRDHKMRIQRTQSRVLILSTLFPVLGWLIHQFICFRGREIAVSESWIVQGQL